MEKTKIIMQLKRTEGQIRGVAQMIEGDRGLVTTMQQFMAVQAGIERAMRHYVELFLTENETGKVELTKEQLDYILKLIK